MTPHSAGATGIAAGIDAAGSVAWPHPDVAWVVNAVSPTNTLPSTVVLTLEPALLTDAYFDRADLIVRSTVGSQAVERTVTVDLTCAPSGNYMPSLAR
ncbi:MAG: hypothetical protein IPK16_20325 [Anaerolineales bacterium]|nr:hypothetical protein [Anaerolineales bacterium]